MKTDKFTNIEYIESFLEFCQADLDTVLIADKLHWGQIFYQLFYDGTPCLDTDFLARFCDEHWNDIETAQENIFSDLNRLLANWKANYAIRILQPADLTCENEKFNFGYFLDYYDSPFYVENIFKEIDIEIWNPNLDPHENPIDQETINRVFLSFFKSIDGFSTDSIKRCQLCNSIFFNSAKRIKLYCSPKCQNTAAVKRLREKQN